MDEIQPLTFSVGETEKIKETVELYLFVKELLIYNEIIDPDSYTFPQVINELRNAYDHFNRVLAEKLKIVDEKEDGYSIENLNKALGHVYRACYDSLDWISVNVKEELINELKPYSPTAIKEVIPNYYSEISTSIPKYERRITELRARKDISSVNSEDLIEFAGIIKELSEIRQQIRDSLGGLIDYESKRKKETTSTDIKNLLLGFFSGLILVLIGIWLT
ncbi:MAG: hypothetical protein K8S15_05500 [Candidatus Aegiribacteria sp.]|nr:hypothetical protein [Candidatus Aegiribacteria sp.]